MSRRRLLKSPFEGNGRLGSGLRWDYYTAIPYKTNKKATRLRMAFSRNLRLGTRGYLCAMVSYFSTTGACALSSVPIRML
jgi:hypothetical protein